MTYTYMCWARGVAWIKTHGRWCLVCLGWRVDISGSVTGACRVSKKPVCSPCQHACCMIVAPSNERRAAQHIPSFTRTRFDVSFTIKAPWCSCKLIDSVLLVKINKESLQEDNGMEYKCIIVIVISRLTDSDHCCGISCQQHLKLEPDPTESVFLSGRILQT